MDEVADRTAAVNVGDAQPQEPSKNALKKAQKQEKLASEKANKSATSTTKEAGRAEAKRAVNKAPKKKIDGAALIGIDVAKEDDFSGWYQQVLTKGDMLDYYDVSGCYILKVGGLDHRRETIGLKFGSHRHTSSGRRYKIGSIRRSKALESRTAHFRCSSHRKCWNEKRITLKALRQRWLGSHTRKPTMSRLFLCS